MGTEGLTQSQLARWSHDLRIAAQADEDFYHRLLAGRAVDALDYDEMREICASFAAISPVQGRKVKAASREHGTRYRSVWERVRRAQTPETIFQWDTEERRRAAEFAAQAKEIKSQTPPARKQQLTAQYGKAPTQRHRKHNASPGVHRGYA